MKNNDAFSSCGRGGSAIFMAIILGAIFFMVVSSLLHYLSGEKRQVKHVIGKKQAEVLALSGLDWADQELRKGRWYQDPWGTTVTGGGRPSCGIRELTPFGPAQGKVTVVCEDIPCKKPVSNIRNMQQLWLLHHINVYALGEYAGSQCLVYGRFIMSPEPALNDNSTEAVIFADQAGGNPRFTAVKVPSDATGSRFKLLSINVGVGDNVDINKIMATLEPVGGSSGQIVELRPSSHGCVRSLNARVGDLCSAGDVFAVLYKGSGSDEGGDSRTLKRMVRITRIDDLPWATMNILDFQDRYSLAARMGVLGDIYLMNHSSREDLMKAVGKHSGGGLPETMEPEEFLRIFPGNVRNPNRDRAENDFMTHVLRNFSIAPVRNLKDALRKTMLELDHPLMDVPPALRAKLQELDLMNLRDTKPRTDSRFFKPKIQLDEFLDLLKPELNSDSDTFIKTLSELPDASRWIEVVEDKKLKTKAPFFKETNAAIGVIKPEAQAMVTVKKITKPYDFVDSQTGFKTRMGYLMDFIRKYYSDENTTLPREETRNIEFLDWPLPELPGATPPSKGNGEWVWCPGEPGVPPGQPVWSYKGGREILNPFPSGGRRDFEHRGGAPDEGAKSYTVDGVAPKSSDRLARDNGMAPDGSGDFSTGPAGAPIKDGDGSSRNGASPEGGSDKNSSAGGAPEEDTSIFSTQHPPVKIPTGGKWSGTPGPAGIPPTKGEWAWVEPCPCGGSPAGGGGQKAHAADGSVPGDGSAAKDGTGGDPAGTKGEADKQALGKDGKPAGADALGKGKDGGPGQADGFGKAQDGTSGQSNGYGTGADGKPGSIDGDGTKVTGTPGQSGASEGNSPAGKSGSPGKPGSSTVTGKPAAPDTTGKKPVYTCPGCGQLHKDPRYKGDDDGGNGRSGGGSSGSSGGC